MRTSSLASLAGAAVALAAAGSAAAQPITVPAPECTVNALDCVAIDNFSATADATSDALFVTSIAAPVALELGRGLDDDSARRGIAYGSAVGSTALLALVTKLTVRRERPYTHNPDPDVQRFAKAAYDRDHSFFSGHTSIAFAAATSSGVLHNAVATGDRTRYGIWATSGALAAATGMLRVRSGRHYPTDVLVGAAVGTAAGIGLTLAIAPDAELRWQDAASFGAGVVVGAAVAGLVPLPKDVIVPLGGSNGVVVQGPVAIAPMAVPGAGLGFALTAQMR